MSPVAPDAEAPSAIPLLLDALVHGLAGHHRVLSAFPTVGAGDERAAARLAADGIEVVTAPRGDGGWRRRRALARAWALGPWPWRTAWFHAPALQAALDGLLARRRVDAVVLEDAAAAYRLPPGTPTVVTEHEARRAVSTAGLSTRQRLLELHEARRFPAHRLETWARADVIQVFTREERDVVAATAPALAERVRVVPFGVPLGPVAPPAEPGARDVLFTGSFAHPPNVDAAIWLATEILPALPEATLTIVGPEAPAAVLALAGPRVRVLGAVPSLDPLVAQAAVLAAPVRTGGGMRMKVLHGLASGRPVVTTTLGAQGLDIGGPPPLLIADDTAAMVTALRRLLEDDALRAELAARGRAHVEAGYGPAAYGERVAASAEAAIARARTAHG